MLPLMWQFDSKGHGNFVYSSSIREVKKHKTATANLMGISITAIGMTTLKGKQTNLKNPLLGKNFNTT